MNMFKSPFASVSTSHEPYLIPRVEHLHLHAVLHQTKIDTGIRSHQTCDSTIFTTMKVSDNFLAFADRFNRTFHITQAILVLCAFIIGCALLATATMPRSRSTSILLAYSVKSALFLLYQYLTTHKQRFMRWASPKANCILDVLDCLLWFTAFIITVMGGGSCEGELLCADWGCGDGCVTALVSLTSCLSPEEEH